jgi:hypothetical protein
MPAVCYVIFFFISGLELLPGFFMTSGEVASRKLRDEENEN